MVHHGRVELLAHPLSQKYLQMKWNSYGKYFHMAHLLLYSIYLFFVTLFTLYLVAANINVTKDKKQDKCVCANTNSNMVISSTIKPAETQSEQRGR